MKIIHTSDWHLGNKMHDIDRNGEHSAFLRWLKEEIVRQNAQALIIAGDIFDTANPPTDARAQYHDFLSSLLTTSCKNVLIIGGNHDSAALLDSEKSILAALNIQVIGSVSNLLPSQMVFELKDKDSKTGAICALVPFAREAELRKYIEEDNAKEGLVCDTAYSHIYAKVLTEAQKLRGQNKIPLILTGHLYASELEGRFEGLTEEQSGDDGRRKLDVVGNLGLVHSNIFPKEFDYVALGHIHYSTRVAKNPRIRYSGSPFVMGFDEASIKRVVLCVDFDDKTEPVITPIEVPQTFVYRRLNGDFNTIKTLLEEYDKTPPTKQTYLELYYKYQDGINIDDMLEESISRLQEKNVFVVSRRVQQLGEGLSFSQGYSMEEIANLNPVDIFKSLILQKSLFNTAEKTQEDIDKEKEEILKKYLPLFTKTFEELGENL